MRTTRTTRRRAVTRRATPKTRKDSAIMKPSDFRGRDTVSSVRRTLASGARKVSRELNHKLI